MTEKQLHKQTCDYLKLQHPKVIFNTDMSGIKLTIGQAKQAKELRSDEGFPDIMIFECSKPVFDDISLYSALFLEIKKETPYKIDGTLKKMTRYENVGGIEIAYDHLQRQNDMHIRLRKRGYMAEFVWTFSMIKEVIDTYLKG